MSEKDSTSMHRRRFLTAVTAAGATIGIAGCSSGNSSDTTTTQTTTTNSGNSSDTTTTQTTTTTTPETTTQQITEQTTAKTTTTQTAEPISAGTELRFEGVTSGWKGRAPERIEGTTNPTLRLKEGAEYTFWWENTDGAPHNVVIENESGDTQFVKTEIISSGTQSVTFTAESGMASYYCEIHPSSMWGPIEII